LKHHVLTMTMLTWFKRPPSKFRFALINRERSS